MAHRLGLSSGSQANKVVTERKGGIRLVREQKALVHLNLSMLHIGTMAICGFDIEINQGLVESPTGQCCI